MKRHLILLLAALLCASALAAQSRREALLEYQSRRRQAYADFRDNYRKSFADFMRRHWEAFRAEQPIAQPERPEPDVPVRKEPGSAPSPQGRIPHGEVTDLPVPEQTPGGRPQTQDRDDGPAGETPGKTDPPQPAETPDRPASPAADRTSGGSKRPEGPRTDTGRPFAFAFYGTDCSVTLTPAQRVRLSSLQESGVANAWERIAAGGCDRAAEECLELKRQLNLNDWGYYDLVRTLAGAFYDNRPDESVLLQSFLMAEAGYKVRLARGGGRLCLLLALDGQVYGKPYFRIGGERFFLLDDAARSASYNICDFSIPGERPLSMAMASLPTLAERPAAESLHELRAAGLSTKVSVNRNVIDFLNGYPACPWEIYAATPLSPRTRAQLLPTLRAALTDMSETQAANLLLHYLHDFPYRTDAAQFGTERTFFAEEMYHYPYSDCEDRAILYAQLVRELLGLRVVLLYYPQHIAAAVRFRDEVAGDYVQLGGDRYTVCDPTYIGADIGEAMPDLKQTPARIIRID